MFIAFADPPRTSVAIPAEKTDALLAGFAKFLASGKY
jgi:hypothetical protein